MKGLKYFTGDIETDRMKIIREDLVRIPCESSFYGWIEIPRDRKAHEYLKHDILLLMHAVNVFAPVMDKASNPDIIEFLKYMHDGILEDSMKRLSLSLWRPRGAEKFAIFWNIVMISYQKALTHNEIVVEGLLI